MRLLRSGDPYRGRQSQKGRTRGIGGVRKYAIDHTFFDHVDSEEKAYWLGFFTADGCVLNHRKLQVNLQASDAGHLEKLNKSLSSNYPIAPNFRSPQSGPSVHWVAASAALVQALESLGVGPRKSASVQPWVGPADLARHYWRGMIDGDGGFSLRPGKPGHPTPQWCMSLAGSRACIDGFASWARAVTGSRSQARPAGHSATCWAWAVGGNRMVKRLAVELYGDCHISLDRKQELANAIIGL